MVYFFVFLMNLWIETLVGAICIKKILSTWWFLIWRDCLVFIPVSASLLDVGVHMEIQACKTFRLPSQRSANIAWTVSSLSETLKTNQGKRARLLTFWSFSLTYMVRYYDERYFWTCENKWDSDKGWNETN